MAGECLAVPVDFEEPQDSRVSDDPESVKLAANEQDPLVLAADDDSSSDGKTKADNERSFVDRFPLNYTMSIVSGQQ
jgi:hypothetical protein